MNNTAFFVSEERLHAHQAISRRERELANELHEQLRSLSALKGFTADDRYRRLMKDAANLRAFLTQLADEMDNFEDLVRDTAGTTRRILEDAGDEGLPRPPMDLDA